MAGAREAREVRLRKSQLSQLAFSIERGDLGLQKELKLIKS